MSALLSFFGGSVFRMLWGELSAAWTKHQEHKHELEMMRLQGDLEAAQHSRNMESIRTQHELGVQTIRVKAEADQSAGELYAWVDAVKATSRMTGIKIIDGWNQGIRPAGATMALVMIASEIIVAGWVISPENREVLFAFLGLFVADRSLAKRGK